MTANSIVAFILARIQEDEQVAIAASHAASMASYAIEDSEHSGSSWANVDYNGMEAQGHGHRWGS